MTESILQNQLVDLEPRLVLLRIQIKEDLPETEATICLLILYDLLYGDWDLDHISFTNLSFYADEPKEVIKILPYITGDHTHLLDIKMYYQEDGEKHKLTGDQIKLANNGSIYHPVTNDLLNYDEASEKVFMYFVASDLIKELRDNSKLK